MWKDIGENTFVLEVPGGWIVRYNYNSHMVFVPDPGHGWKWGDEKKT